VRLSPLGTSAINWPIVPAPDDNDECGAVGGMRIGRGNRSTRKKPAPVPLYPPQILHDLTWVRTRTGGGKPASNGLSYGTAQVKVLSRDLPLLSLFTPSISLYRCDECGDEFDRRW
jgi:hypothetical protein